MRCDVLIIGGGPAGLTCARELAAQGVRVILLEKAATIGKKVCAGGITWSGLIGRIPSSLVERSFSEQKICTRFQSVTIGSENPMVATVNRERLGQYMAEQALQAGAEIITGARFSRMDQEKAWFITDDSSSFSVRYGHLVGADGAYSRVRSHLGLSTESWGIGLQYTLPATLPEMVWNFDARRFGSGYSWVFPHRATTSVGAYASSRIMNARTLKAHLDGWLEKRRLPIRGHHFRAARVNCDFRGWRHGRVFLVGDAAGLASPLTGEGIFPAILSGETTANAIVDRTFAPSQLEALIAKQRKHQTMQRFAGNSVFMALFLSELSAFMLKHRMITFKSFEMA